MSEVALIGCNSYDSDEVFNAMKRGIGLLGGINHFFKSDEKILLKPNLLVGEPPSNGVTTHPEVFRAIASILNSEEKFLISYGDSPAFGSLDKASKRSGLKSVADSLGIGYADFHDIVNISYPKAMLAKKLPIARGALEADSIISISKMKTHGFTRITGAVKNQFGCVPGILKAEFHAKMPDIEDFSKMLIDINTYLKPKLYIMDGIIAMEGNGPRGGNTVHMNVILLSSDPIALDFVFCKLIGLDPEFVPTMKFGSEAGLGEFDFNKIKIIGDNWQDFYKKDFNVKRVPYERFASKKKFPVFIKNIISPKPVINYDLCKNCGKCVIQCPTNPKSVNWANNNSENPPSHNYNLCIRCYCCQEICPYNAISIKTPLIGKIIKRGI